MDNHMNFMPLPLVAATYANYFHPPHTFFKLRRMTKRVKNDKTYEVCHTTYDFLEPFIVRSMATLTNQKYNFGIQNHEVIFS